MAPQQWKLMLWFALPLIIGAMKILNYIVHGKSQFVLFTFFDEIQLLVTKIIAIQCRRRGTSLELVSTIE